MPQTVQEFHSWRASQEDAIKSREDELFTRLLETIPPGLAVWKTQSAGSVVRDIIKYGMANRKYRSNQLGDYGFTSLSDCEQKLRLLVSAWADVIIAVNLWEEDQTVTVSFEV